MKQIFNFLILMLVFSTFFQATAMAYTENEETKDTLALVQLPMADLINPIKILTSLTFIEEIPSYQPVDSRESDKGLEF